MLFPMIYTTLLHVVPFLRNIVKKHDITEI